VPDIGDKLVGRESRPDVGAEKLELGFFPQTDLKLHSAVNAGAAEGEDARLRAFAERQVEAAQVNVRRLRKPHFLELFSGTNGHGQRLGKLLPDRPQCVEVGIAPFLLAPARKRSGHAAASE
jgi:hypothetical protein